MIGALRAAYDRFRGAGAAAVTVPPMDGALRPNTVLDDAAVVASLPAPDNLVSHGSRLWLSSGPEVYVIEDLAAGGTPQLWSGFPASVSCLAAGPDGALAVGLSGTGIEIRGGIHGDKALATVSGRPIDCPVAVAFVDQNTVLLCLGSARHRPEDWKRDLMSRGATGSVWQVDLATGAGQCLGDGLRFPFGLVAHGARVVVAESWSHRLIALDARGGRSTVLDDLPGYPARLSAAGGGGFWLSVFAPRDQLVEFILQERSFCGRMMSEVEPEYWMAPALATGVTFLEPLQGGAIRQLGKLKPWAPSRSYGLLVRLDANFQPVASYHSRADGRRHGITSAVEVAGRVVLTSKGGNAVIAVSPDAEGA